MFINTPPPEHLTADQVRKLPIGEIVTLHGVDRYGQHTQLACKVVQSGKKKVLEYEDRSQFFMLRTKTIKDYPNKYYTKGGPTW